MILKNLCEDIEWVATANRECCPAAINTLRPRQNGRHFADAIFKCISLNENAWVPIKISLKIVPRGPINNIPALVQIMAWRRPGDKPLSGPMMVRLPMHICVTRPQWVNIAGATILTPYHVVKSLQLIWRFGTRRFHPRVPDLQMSCSDLTYR